MALRKVTHVAREERIFRGRTILGRVIALANEGEPWSPVRTREALRHLATGMHTYHTSVPGQPESRIVAVGGDHLRASPDPNSPNNLYSLPLTGLDRTPTGDFDVGIYLSAEATGQVLSALHAAGVLPHTGSTMFDGQFLDLSFGVPTLTPLAGEDNQANVSTEVLCWVRPADDPFAPGFSAHAVIRSRVQFAVGARRADSPAHLFAWYAPQTQNQISVTAATPTQRQVVSRALAQWARSNKPGAFPLNLDDRLGDPRTIHSIIDEQCNLVAGLTYSNEFLTSVLPADRPDTPFAVSLSAAYLADHIYASLAANLGAAPPPAGPAPVVLDAATGTALESLLVEATASGLTLSGFLARNGAREASFTVPVIASLNASELAITVGDIEVDALGLFNDIANFVSGGALEDGLRAGIRAALADPAGTGNLGSMVSETLFGALASVGTAPEIDLHPALTGLQLSANGLTVTGNLSTSGNRPVVATLSTLVRDAQTPVILSGTQSWAPGQRIARTRWEFGDGTEINLEDEHCALVTQHQYGAGSWQAKLTVVREDGNSAEATAVVTVA